MARMFPPRIAPDVKSSAEIRLYNLFKNQLSDRFLVFHQVCWQNSSLKNGSIDGEADFIIVHADLGILLLEAKGGKIQVDGDRWYSNQHEIKNPFKQVERSKYSLIELLKKHRHWRERWLNIGHAVAFPDIFVGDGFGLNASKNIILDSCDLNKITFWVESVLKYYQSKDKEINLLTPKDIERLTNIFYPRKEISILLSNEIAQHRQTRLQLSEQQFRILNHLNKHRRMAISGCAGSGKTILAVEKALRLHEQGFTVLLTCFNQKLAKFLSSRLGKIDGFYIHHFHQLCYILAKKASINIDRIIQENEQDKNKLYDSIYPNLLIEAADRLNWRVDAVIIDEGQDFHENWWIALKLLLNDPDNGIFYFFYDDNQDIYKKGWHPNQLEEFPFPLIENWRNTKKNSAYVQQYYQGENQVTAIGDDGRDIEIYEYDNTHELKRKLAQILDKLTTQEQVKIKNIVILTTRKMPDLENKYISKFLIKAQPELNKNQIECHTIHHFKGLERAIVILIDHDTQRIPHRKKLLYVGA